jgi:hypothetical protein
MALRFKQHPYSTFTIDSSTPTSTPNLKKKTPVTVRSGQVRSGCIRTTNLVRNNNKFFVLKDYKNVYCLGTNIIKNNFHKQILFNYTCYLNDILLFNRNSLKGLPTDF